ncbi:MAG: hypothetical protein KC609_13595 [Myxococcales bacterium]|nr:hypothetical protein [Myxococcales bacterium]
MSSRIAMGFLLGTLLAVHSANGATTVAFCGQRIREDAEAVICRRQPVRSLRPLAKLRQLKWLELKQLHFADDELVHLRGLRQLKRLYLIDDHLDGRGLVHLAGLTNLRTLDLARNPLTDRRLPALLGLRALGKLKKLVLARTSITDRGVAQLLPRLAAIRQLDLDFTSIGDAALIGVARLKRLSLLGLVGTRITERTLRRLETMRQLTFVAVAGTCYDGDESVKRLRMKLGKTASVTVNHPSFPPSHASVVERGRTLRRVRVKPRHCRSDPGSTKRESKSPKR